MHNESTGIPALTIGQPWAWLISQEIKTVENRTWRTRYRGPVWIHAGKSRKWMDAVPQLRAAGHAIPADLPFGAIVARARIVDCVPIDAGDLFLDLKGDPFATGPWCWLLEDVEALKTPVVCDGALGLWRLVGC